ncbi:MmgE/PrpD family protein, partial [Pseudomonas sp.]|uniref:MmgE/PrpD family protein n=1 Tax=Pseudomonas sp. TaxID=306 RepID=UPI00299D4EF9
MSLYSFVRDFTFKQAPQHTRDLLQTCLLDILGVAAGARDNQTSQALRQYAIDHYPAGALASRLLFDGRAVHPLGASWAGGFSVDSLDAHEGHFTSKGHAGATVVPALLALVDACREQGRSISGEELLSALCIGYETALRAGVALMATAPEYHASGAFSGLGVVCAGARLLDLDEQTFRHALGIAEYFGPRC